MSRSPTRSPTASGSPARWSRPARSSRAGPAKALRTRQPARADLSRPARPRVVGSWLRVSRPGRRSVPKGGHRWCSHAQTDGRGRWGDAAAARLRMMTSAAGRLPNSAAAGGLAHLPAGRRQAAHRPPHEPATRTQDRSALGLSVDPIGHREVQIRHATVDPPLAEHGDLTARDSAAARPATRGRPGMPIGGTVAGRSLSARS
jgi:hypothetical protein